MCVCANVCVCVLGNVRVYASGAQHQSQVAEPQSNKSPAVEILKSQLTAKFTVSHYNTAHFFRISHIIIAPVANGVRRESLR